MSDVNPLVIVEILTSFAALVPELQADTEAVLPIVEEILNGNEVSQAQIVQLDALNEALSQQAADKAASIESE